MQIVRRALGSENCTFDDGVVCNFVRHRFQRALDPFIGLSENGRSHPPLLWKAGRCRVTFESIAKNITFGYRRKPRY